MNSSTSAIINQKRTTRGPMSPSTKEKLAQYHQSLKEESEKLESLSSEAHLMQQQIGSTSSTLSCNILDLYQFEKKAALEKLNKVFTDFSKADCDLIMKIKKPSSEMTNIVEVFAKILSLKYKNWKSFKVRFHVKNLNCRKSLRILGYYIPRWGISNLKT